MAWSARNSTAEEYIQNISGRPISAHRTVSKLGGIYAVMMDRVGVDEFDVHAFFWGALIVA